MVASLVVSASGCMSEPLGYGEEGSIGDVTSAEDDLTVAQAVTSRCSTTAVFGQIGRASCRERV